MTDINFKNKVHNSLLLAISKGHRPWLSLISKINFFIDGL
jgi:hypothetical protein